MVNFELFFCLFGSFASGSYSFVVVVVVFIVCLLFRLPSSRNMSEVFALECVIEKARQDSGAVCAHSTWLLSGKVRENDGFGGWHVRMASDFQTWEQSVLKKN